VTFPWPSPRHPPLDRWSSSDHFYFFVFLISPGRWTFLPHRTVMPPSLPLQTMFSFGLGVTAARGLCMDRFFFPPFFAQLSRGRYFVPPFFFSFLSVYSSAKGRPLSFVYSGPRVFPTDNTECFLQVFYDTGVRQFCHRRRRR